MANQYNETFTVELAQFIDACKAIKNRDEKAYREASEELLSIGYLLKLDEEGEPCASFVGPVKSEERADYTEYLTSIYESVTEAEEEQKKEEAKSQEKTDASTVLVIVLLLGVAGFAGYSLRSHLINLRNM